MIEKMKKLEVILLAQDRLDFLQQLQSLGVVHINQVKTQVVDEELDKTISSTMSALKWLGEIQKRYEISIPQDHCAEGMDTLVSRLLTSKKELLELENQRRELGNRISRLEPYGQMDPDLIKQLQKAGMIIELCNCKLTDYNPEGGDAVETLQLNQKESAVYFAAVHHKADSLSTKDKAILAMQEDIPFEDITALKAQMDQFEAKTDSILRSAIDSVRYIDHLTFHVRRLGDMVEFTTALNGLEQAAEGSLCVLSGWFPAKSEEGINKFFEARSEAWFISDPQQEEKVPVKLKHNWFSRMFAPIMKVYSLPNYHELDTTPFFAPFYTLFFGLCVADVGYALILLAVLAVVALKGRKGPLGSIFGLATVLSLSVLVAGILLNDYFGIKLEADGTGIGALLGGFAYFKVQQDAMLLPIVLGVLQVSLGYILRGYSHVRNHGWQGALMPLGVLGVMLGIIFYALQMLGPDFHVGPWRFGYAFQFLQTWVPFAMIGAGLFFILFFNNVEHHTPWYKRPLHGLWNLYELATGLPGDILSYLRLFALGLAGGLLAEAVNHIGEMVIHHNEANPLAWIGMVAVLLVGHGLNFGIGLLSAFVHSLRLTFVEFYKSIEFKGGGIPYEEFKLDALEAPEYRIHLKDQLAR